MRQVAFYLRASVTDLAKNKGRSFLTSLGIIIGVYSVILLLSLGEGLKTYIEQQFESLGTNLIFVLPGKIKGANTDNSMMGGAKFNSSDLQRLRRGLTGGTVIAPASLKNVVLKSRKDTLATSLIGSTREISTIYNLGLSEGRFFSKSEELSGRKVVILGSKVANDLFDASPIGETVELNGIKFRVIGVAEPKGGGGFGGPTFDDYLYSPYRALFMLTDSRYFVSFYIKAASKEEVGMTMAKAERILSKTYKEEDFSLSTQEELLATISGIFAIINSVLVGIAAISLLVGGIGITNIMYVTVTERIKEIGIRRAVGAREGDILLQFLTSSVLLTTAGGFIGVGLAYLTSLGLQPFFPAKVTLSAIILAFFVSLVIGVVFGVFPARKAAKLSPVEAIRYE